MLESIPREVLILLGLVAGVVLSRLLRRGARGRLDPRPGASTARPSGPAPTPDAEVQALARSGNKIEAIKRYRKATGLGLKESKDVIDRLDR
ncbi:ribosomal protein L7/L12 [Panacagrimonas sp.]|uniref:ribosomal protein L7/L12 n=1 Tax=Panacagrimonas sp. TaxID=2480088 RepID=UPI003B52B78F